MPVTARIHSISKEAYAAARRGDSCGFILDSADGVLDLDWTWHAIHYLLTGDLALTFLLSGFQIPNVADHSQVHSPDSVKDLQTRLAGTSAETIMTGFDPAHFSKLRIYPFDTDWQSWLSSTIKANLHEFLRKLNATAANNQGLLVAIA